VGLNPSLKNEVAGPKGPVSFNHPETLVTLDFETRAVRDLLKVGAHIYTLCPDFDVLCLSFAVNDEPVINCRGPMNEESKANGLKLDKLNSLAKNPKVIFEAHYVGFEFWVWHNYMVPKYGFSPIPIERWRCSAAAAASRGFPRSLFGVCQATGSPIQKDMEGKKIMLKMCKPLPEPQRKKFGGSMWAMSEELMEKLMAYCGVDVTCERASSKIVGPMTPSEQEVWVEDQKLNQRGVFIDMELAYKGLEMVNKLKAEWARDCKAKYGFNPTQVQEVKNWMKSKGVIIPMKRNPVGTMVQSMGAQFLDKLYIQTDDVEIREVINFRKDAGSPSLSKYKNCILMAEKGICRDQFIMNGANTGRWSSKGVQFHNFPRGTLVEKHEEEDMEMIVNAIKEGDTAKLQWVGEMEGMKTAMRGLIVAPPGKRLYVMDYSQIEARIMAWLAGQDDVLKSFEDGKDLYKVTAAMMNNIEYKDVTKEERFLGKVGSLSLQYQGGEDAFISMATNYGKVIPRKEAIRIKKLWREANPEICDLWGEYQWAAIGAIERGGTRKVGRIMFRKEGDFLKCRLPSGRCLHYYKPEVRMVTVHPKAGQDFKSFDTKQMTYMGSDSAKGIVWDRVSIYGGRWSENICQAIGADILRIPMVEIPKRKKWRCMFDLECIFHTHDEIGALGPDDEHWKERLAEMQHVMLEVPDCYDGLPMAAEGFSGYRYRKD